MNIMEISMDVSMNTKGYPRIVKSWIKKMNINGENRILGADIIKIPWIKCKDFPWNMDIRI